MSCKQLLRLPARQANSLHPPHTAERPSKTAPKSRHKLARLFGDPSWLRCKVKKQIPAFVGKQLLRLPCRRHTVCIHLAPHSKRNSVHRRAATSMLDWSKICHGCGAKQRRRKEAVVGKQLLRWTTSQANNCIRHAPWSSREPARLVGEPSRHALRCKATKKVGSLCWQAVLL